MKKRLGIFYDKLYRALGRQNWWPANSSFEVIVGAILTQNTNWQNVEKAISNLKKANLLSAARLHRLSEKQIARLIRPAGFFNTKARYLKAFLDFFSANYGMDMGRLKRQPREILRKQLLSVKGIGPETADSILLYALNKPIFVVDAYTKRIFSRHKFFPQRSSYAEVQNLFSQNLKNKVELFNEYHALIVRLAKEYCLKNNPECGKCPLKGQ